MTLDLLNPYSYWPQLALLGKLFGFLLCAAALYALSSLIRIWYRSRAISKHLSEAESSSAKRLLLRLQNTASNYHQFIFTAALFFGLTFFIQIPAAFVSLGDSKSLPWNEYFQNLAVQFAFAADVFLVLIILHTAEWIVSAHLRRLTLPH